MSDLKLLSVIVPAYNEEEFIGTLLDRVLAEDFSDLGVETEVIVVDDGSTDRTPEIVAGKPSVRLHVMEQNGGKGTAVRQGIHLARGQFVIIQDADLEYDPADYRPMLERLLAGGCDAVYGSRYLGPGGRAKDGRECGGRHAGQSLAAYLGGRSLSLVALLLTGHFLTDTVTALKLFRSEVLTPLELVTTGFELDHEITAKILATGARIAEVPISYDPRGKAAGKKIGLRDWFRAVHTFWRFGRRGGAAGRCPETPSIRAPVTTDLNGPTSLRVRS